MNCKAFTAFDAPKVKVIKASAFQKCEKFSGFNSFDVELIYDLAFESVKGIKELKLDKLTGFGIEAFKNSYLEKVTLSSLQSFGTIDKPSKYSNAFRYCEFLEELYLPEVVTLSGTGWNKTSGHFQRLGSLRVFSAPKLKTLPELALDDCYNLEK